MAEDDQDDPLASGGSVGEPAGAPPPPQSAPAPGVPSAGRMPAPPPMPSSDRAYIAYQHRGETDYIFDYWSALGWTILTIGIYGLYVFYQLVRRMRDHNARRVELLDATLAFAWEEAGRRGLQEELTPSFQRAGAHMDVLRGMTRDFRDPSFGWCWPSSPGHCGDHRLRAVGPGSGEARSRRGRRGVRAVADIRELRPSRARTQSRSCEGREQLRRADSGHGLFVGHLPLLVVLQPDERP